MRLGMIGVGGIGNLIGPTLCALDEVECYAVASRSLDRAKTYAERFGYQRAYGSYEELLDDPLVELVYVATPHAYHYEHIMMSLERGKSVLCEKAFTLNGAQARQAAGYARERGIFLAEAMWPRYMPSRAILQRVIDSGIIGKVNTLAADLSYAVSHKKRITDPKLAGGALLDVGVYGLNFALMHFGLDIERVESSVHFAPTGVDDMESITIFYRDGRMAVLTHSIYARSDRKGLIRGDKGYIIVENINNPQSVSVFDTEDRLIEYHAIPKQISGYEYEFLECIDAISRGKTESGSMPLDESIRLMELMDTLRKQWGLVYPQEKK